MQWHYVGDDAEDYQRLIGCVFSEVKQEESYDNDGISLDRKSVV